MNIYSYQLKMNLSNYASRCQYVKNYMIMMAILYLQSQCYCSILGRLWQLTAFLKQAYKGDEEKSRVLHVSGLD